MIDCASGTLLPCYVIIMITLQGRHPSLPQEFVLQCAIFLTDLQQGLLFGHARQLQSSGQKMPAEDFAVTPSTLMANDDLGLRKLSQRPQVVFYTSASRKCPRYLDCLNALEHLEVTMHAYVVFAITYRFIVLGANTGPIDIQCQESLNE